VDLRQRLSKKQDHKKNVIHLFDKQKSESNNNNKFQLSKERAAKARKSTQHQNETKM
jgi:hypothetical protein